ncbi:hypothetical protein Tco_0624130 [Tanacetum coccineum]|uniref:Uncharacterized protein n=1 Tax=Tanacetum coccineum TaxID=301880 RepID=A0ABQ4WD70_9ASTR
MTSPQEAEIEEHNKRNKANPIRLNFETEDPDPKEDRIVKGREIDDEDLSKPFKETLKTPFTRRIIEFSGPEYSMPTNIALYNGSTDPADHLNRFVGAANSGEWPMPSMVIRMFQHNTGRSGQGGGKANETLTAFKERWTVETGFIMGVPEVMKISSFMDSVKSPELAKRFAVAITVGESQDIHRRLSFPEGSRDVHHPLNFSVLPEERPRRVELRGKDFAESDLLENFTRVETTLIREDTEITEARTTKGNEQQTDAGYFLSVSLT